MTNLENMNKKREGTFSLLTSFLDFELSESDLSGCCGNFLIALTVERVYQIVEFVVFKLTIIFTLSFFVSSLIKL